MKTKQILSIMNVIAWIIFIGLCIKTGSVLYSLFVSLAINPAAAKNLYITLDLSSLHKFDTWHYVAVVSTIIFLTALKAYIFYLVIKVFLKINFVQPFSEEISVLISRIGYMAVETGLITFVAYGYTSWLIKRGVSFPDLQEYLGGAAEFLIFGGIIFIISQVFKRGMEIQSENELTV